MLDALAVASIGLAIVSILFVVVLVARRVHLAGVERRRREAEARLLPKALGLLDGEEPGAIGDADAFADLLARLGRQLEGDARERLAAWFEREGFVDRELGRLRSRRAWKRAAAAFTLGDMGAARAAPALVGALQDDDREVRTAAARSLGRLRAVEAVTPLAVALAAHRVSWVVGGHALLSLGPAAVPDLTRLSRRPEPELRARSAELVGLIGAASDATALQAALRDTSAEVRERAARALGRLGARSASEELRTALGDRIPGVRAAAAASLGDLRDREAVPQLLDQARGDAFEPARAAAQAVARIDRRALAEAAGAPDAGAHLHEAVDLLAVR